MKKLILILFVACMTIAVSAQGLFKPVPKNLFTSEKAIKAGETNRALIWRFDATVSIAEMNYNKVTKQLMTSAFSAVGPAIGLQNYVPGADGLPYNNWGVSAAVLLGTSIYEPDLSSIKIALQANILQYLKFGITVSPKPATDLSAFGFYFGTGITF